MTKFRLSNHKLMIEKGRHRGLDKSARICPFCNTVKDEIHFLINCKEYRHIRAELLTKVTEVINIQSIETREHKDLFKILLSRKEVLPLVAKYLTKSMELRDFLIEKPRQFM